jgi:hypothetical protein
MTMRDPDADRRSRTLLGWIRRLFDRDSGSDWQWYDWWDDHRGSGIYGPHWPGWGGMGASAADWDVSRTGGAVPPPRARIRP